MLGLAFAYISRLSEETLQPSRSSQAMHDFLCSNLSLTRRVASRNLLSDLMKKNIGTNDCENAAAKLAGQWTRKISTRGLVTQIMTLKLRDAEHCIRVARREFLQKKREYYRWVRRGTIIDLEMLRVVRTESERLWHMTKENNKKKVGQLFQKWGPKVIQHQEPDIRGVLYKDEDLNVSINDKNDEATIYGGSDIP